MYRKMCSLAVLVLLCGIASAAPVWVFDTSDPAFFVPPWVSGNEVDHEFVLDDVNGVAYTSTVGQGYANFVTDSNVISVAGNRFFDMDIWFDSTQPGNGIISMLMDVDPNAWSWKWVSSSEVSVDGGPFTKIFSGVMQNLSQDTWHTLKFRLETGNPEGSWHGGLDDTWPADPCIGPIHIGLNDNAKVYAKDVFFNDTPTGAAYGPTPASGDTGVDVDVTLSWLPGAQATSHTVYIGTDLAAVENGTATSYSPGTTSLTLSLDLAKTYYWKVVEYDESNYYASNIWSFQTIECFVIDDFEAYGTSLPTYWSTLEQYTTVSLEAGITRDTKSMKLAADTYNPPYLGTSQRAYTTALDLTEHGIASISFWVRGHTDNDAAEPIYFKLQDSSGNRGKYVFTDGSYVQSEYWNQLHVPLNGLVIDGTASLPDLSDITKLQIGTGDGLSGTTGDYTKLYVDDIEIHPQRCVPALVAGDFTNDCTVDAYDLRRMARHWLYNPNAVPDVEAEEPANPPLIYYSFDQGEGPTCQNDANPGTYDADMKIMDGSGNNQASDPWFPVNEPAGDPNIYWDRRETNMRRQRDPETGELLDPNQAIPTDPNYRWDPPAYDGNCIDCESRNPAGTAWDGATYAKIPADFWTHIDKQITITAWAATDPCDLPQPGGGSYYMLFQGENALPAEPGTHKLMAILGLPEGDNWDPNAVEWRAGLGTDGGDEQGVIGQGTNQLLWRRAYTDYPEELTTVPWNNANELSAWKHFAFVKDASSGFMRIYCNGIARASSDTKFQSMAGVVEFIIGGSVDNWTGHCFRGKIDEFRIYDYALSQAEVMYLAERAGADPSADSGPSVANIKDDASDEWPGIVNFLDLATLAPNWQRQNVMFPE